MSRNRKVLLLFLFMRVGLCLCDNLCGGEVGGIGEDGFEYNFVFNSNEAKSFQDANTSCASQGGTLAILDNTASLKAVEDIFIKNTDASCTIFAWVGATAVNINSIDEWSWKWQNGNKVDNSIWWDSPEHRWSDANCMYLHLERGHFVWSNRNGYCTNLSAYICQIRKDSTEIVRLRQYTTTFPELLLSCEAVGPPRPDITWKVNDEDIIVTGNNEKLVGNWVFSVLEISQPPCMGEFTVTCFATDERSENNNSKSSNVSSIESYIPIGNVEITSKECNTHTVDLSWLGHDLSNFHVIYNITWSVVGSMNQSHAGISSPHIVLRNIEPGKEYDVTITGITSPQCDRGYVNFTKTFTKILKSLPSAVTSVDIFECSKAEEYSCCTRLRFYYKDINALVWKSQVTNQHTKESNLKEIICNPISSCSRGNGTYEMKGNFPPNSIINGEVFATSCVGNSSHLRINNTCKTVAAAPDEVRLSSHQTFSSDGTFPVHLYSSDEKNGEITCYLLVMEQSNGTEKRIDIFQQFVDNIQQPPPVEPSPDKPYFALALKRFENEFMDLIVGNDDETSCMIKRTNGSNARVYNARDPKLKLDVKYRYFLVTATFVSDRVIVYGASDYHHIKHEQENKNKTGIIIWGIIVVIVVIVVIVIVLCKVRKRNEQHKQNQSGESLM